MKMKALMCIHKYSSENFSKAIAKTNVMLATLIVNVRMTNLKDRKLNKRILRSLSYKNYPVLSLLLHLSLYILYFSHTVLKTVSSHSHAR